jgi:hypothetical protein
MGLLILSPQLKVQIARKKIKTCPMDEIKFFADHN